MSALCTYHSDERVEPRIRPHTTARAGRGELPNRREYPFYPYARSLTDKARRTRRPMTNNPYLAVPEPAWLPSPRAGTRAPPSSPAEGLPLSPCTYPPPSPKQESPELLWKLEFPPGNLVGVGNYVICPWDSTPLRIRSIQKLTRDGIQFSLDPLVDFAVSVLVPPEWARVPCIIRAFHKRAWKWLPSPENVFTPSSLDAGTSPAVSSPDPDDVLTNAPPIIRRRPVL